MQTKSYNLVNNVEQEEMDAGLLAEMYEVEVKDGKSVTLPSVFSSEIREDLIRRAVLASRANRRQAQGDREHYGKRAPQPGMNHSVDWWGTLHQSSSIRLTSAPTIHYTMLIPLIIMFLGMIIYALIIFLMKYKSEIIKFKLDKKKREN